MNTLRTLLLVALAALLATSCRSTMQDAVTGKAQGTSAVYPVPPAMAWSIARNIVYVAAHFGVESNRSRTMITCEAGTGTDTTFISVWIEPGANDDESVVTIRSVKQGAVQIESVLSEADFHAAFAERLKGNPDK